MAADNDLTDRMKRTFLVSVSLMFLHKIECWLADEWLESPFFQAIIQSSHWVGHTTERMMGEVIFLTFCVWLFLGLAIGWLILWGRRGATLALVFWGLTYVLEWHHIVRTISRGAYYPGVVTSVVYLAFGVVYWRELAKHLRSPAQALSRAAIRSQVSGPDLPPEG